MNAWESNNLHQITTNMSLDQLISAMLCSCYIPKGSLVKWHADAFTTNGGILFTGFSLLFTSLLKNKNFWKNKMICSSVRYRKIYADNCKKIADFPQSFKMRHAQNCKVAAKPCSFLRWTVFICISSH